MADSLYPTIIQTRTNYTTSIYTNVRNRLVDYYVCNKQKLLEKIGLTCPLYADQMYDSFVERAIKVREDSLAFLECIKQFERNQSATIQSQQKLYEASIGEDCLFNTSTPAEQPLALKLVQNGHKLLSMLNFAIDTLETMCYKTIADTFASISQCETARLRCAVGEKKLREAQLEKYETLKGRVGEKVRMLEIHKCRVIHRTTEFYEYGMANYFTTSSADIVGCGTAPYLDMEGLPDL